MIICSATINPEKFQKYFNNSPLLQIPGRQHQIQDVYFYDNDRNLQGNFVEFNYNTRLNLNDIVECILQVNAKEEEGDVLVFLTGAEEIEKCEALIFEKLYESRGNNNYRPEVIVRKAYSALPSEEISMIFDATPSGSRKIIISTNICESSITVPGLRYVIDSGLVKQIRYLPDKGIYSLDVEMISKEQADQRKGRAGRTAPGKCFRMYSKEQYERLGQSREPDILRENISKNLLTLKTLGINEAKDFDFIDPPDLGPATRELRALGALSESGKLTRFGARV